MAGTGDENFVGECYIDGLMNGEAFHDIREEDMVDVFIE